MGKRWTSQDVDLLRSLAERYPAPEIAQRMDRTVGGVVFKAYQLKVPLRSRRGITCADPGPAGFDFRDTLS
jgi:hypothetical protein